MHDLHMNSLWVSIAVFLYRNNVLGPRLSQWRHGTSSRVGPKCCSRMGGTSIFWCDRQFNRFWNKDLQDDFCESCIRWMIMLWSMAKFVRFNQTINVVYYVLILYKQFMNISTKCLLTMNEFQFIQRPPPSQVFQISTTCH